MRRRSTLPILLALSTAASMLVGVTPASAADFQADAWIKLCGLSTGCTIDPLPAPVEGPRRLQHDRRKQTVAVRMEDGEGVRFWITVENDGDSGRHHHRRRVPRHAAVQGQRRADGQAQAAGLAGGQRHEARSSEGTLEFSFPPRTEGKRKVFTLNIIAPTTAEGVSRRCVITMRSAADPGADDTVVAKMTTY